MGRSCRATKDGLEKANKALQLKGWTQEYLAGVVNCTRQTVIKFFARRPVEKRLFQAMCIELRLEWGEIAELEPVEEQASRSFGMDTEQENNCEIAQEERSATKVLTTPVSLVKNQNFNYNEQLVITFTGDIETLQKNPDFQSAVLAFMQAVSKDASLTIEKIEKGSIKITFSGSPEGLKRLEELITSGELTEVRGMPVENVQLLTGVTTEEDQDKIRLVQEIITQGAKGQDLSDADLSNVDLRRTDLSNADLSCADLRGTDLKNANLENADLNCADLRGTNLSDANMNRVSLHDAVIDQATIISNKWRLVWEIVNQPSKGRDLDGANLRNANLSRVNLSGANLRNANLSRVNLSGANLRNANLSRVNLSGANLSCAYLNGANLSRVNLSRAYLSGANLSRAYLSGAYLSGANLSRAYLRNAYLSGAYLSGAYLSGAYLIDAYLSRVNLSGADLSRADLSRADLSRADLRNANLSRAYLSDAIVENAQFGRNLGLTEDLKLDLKQRGAIFEDSQGDRSGVLTSR